MLSSSATLLPPLSRNSLKPLIKKPKKNSTTSFTCLRFTVEEITEIAQNKVLVAATAASAIGQLSKPFTSSLSGDAFDFKALIRSGGMPSTHSAAVVAAATSIGLERGFSDSIFGLSVVFAGIVMYDAQGVRKEVGYHANILNRIHLKGLENSPPNSVIDSKERSSSINSETLASVLSVSEKSNSYTPNSEPPSFRRSENRLSRLNALTSSLTVDGEVSNIGYSSYIPLKESVGHTKIEVIVGALVGFLVSLALDMVM
eukprot:TRINITY_DN23982_c0_g1_i1.p1 TRINITY_DN23982_c0_g1~~TRINITY_DN23982_c0_g1_i1.p1  ORF type:complete len:258 (-),score=42.86 TRINITY_DN23982_c0_g1_i1:133-906(-)